MMIRFLTLGAMLLALALFGCDKPEESKSAPDAKESAAETEQQSESTLDEAVEQTRETATDAADKTKETTAAVAEKTEEMADQAAEETKEAAETTAEKVEEAAAATTTAAEEAVEEAKKAVSPETVLLEASFGNVTFPHEMHSGAYDCTTCHGEGTPGLFGLEKDEAHELCKGCHQEEGAGPTACNDCHER